MDVGIRLPAVGRLEKRKNNSRFEFNNRQLYRPEKEQVPQRRCLRKHERVGELIAPGKRKHEGRAITRARQAPETDGATARGDGSIDDNLVGLAAGRRHGHSRIIAQRGAEPVGVTAKGSACMAGT